MRSPYYNIVMYIAESCHTENLLIPLDAFNGQYREQKHSVSSAFYSSLVFGLLSS